ncbi:MAG: RecX family transcriptional regulator, partial [Candidatus Sumerlaeia bacterium]|nr:RecX family transcriptional regulator [Candidatus Sumerlaeia bacterium]
LIDKRKQKFALQLDNGTILELSAETILKNKLRKNQELSRTEIEKILAEDEFIRALAQASTYLSLRKVSQQQLERYLLRKDFKKEIIQQVIANLNERGLLNDLKFAKLFVKDRLKLKPVGPKKLEIELLKKGVTYDVINTVLEPATAPETQKKLARYWAEKKLRTLKTLERKQQKQKLHNFLMNKGFESEIVSEVIQSILNEPSDDDTD